MTPQASHPTRLQRWLSPQQLNARETRTLSAAAEIVLPSGGPFALGFRDIDYLQFVNRYLELAPKDANFLLHLILWTVEYLGWIFLWLPARFSNMSLAKRQQLLDRMRHNRVFIVRGFFLLLSTVLLIPFYRDRRVMDAIGYVGYREDSNKLNEGAA